jgi:hypothetical protein
MSEQSENEKFIKQMEELQVPDINPAHHRTVKMAILSAEKSAALGVWLIVVPCYFLLCVIMYYYFHPHANWFSSMFALIVSLDKNPYLDFLAPIVMVILPIVCIVINALAIIHIGVERIDPDRVKVKEFTVTVKFRLWNIVLILVSMAILLAFVAFSMTQNISITN